MKSPASLLLALVVALAGAALPAQAASRNAAQSAASLSAAERADLSFMREEEKLARDVYLALYERWGLTPFSNISASEQQHMDAILMLLRKYRLPDPAAGRLVGEFSDPDLQILHDTLLARGLTGDVAALKVGGFIEETDIRDLDGALARADNTDIDQVYARLQCGSRNHLRAFARVLEAVSGQAYQAQVIDPLAVETILAGDNETCGR
ncbi:MAG TPA: DUF2202 domain-containing protein [Thiobacillaceae bacterium]|nr:DUF2202 domain-containing protein [Thiobacillaceae bacterium]